jgi:hypothetical protein
MLIGDERISKRLNYFLVSEDILCDVHCIRQWIGGNEFDYLLFFLEIARGG